MSVLRWCRWGVSRVLGTGSGRMGWCNVCVTLDSLSRWQVQVSVCCARRIPVHRMCTLRSILLHLINICFIQCICLWQISQIQTSLCVVVAPGFVATSPAFMNNSASHPAVPHGRLAKNGGIDTICTAACNCRDSSATFRLCRLEPCRLCCLQPIYR